MVHVHEGGNAEVGEILLLGVLDDLFLVALGRVGLECVNRIS